MIKLHNLNIRIYSLFFLLLISFSSWGQNQTDVPTIGLTSPVIGAINYLYPPTSCPWQGNEIWGFCQHQTGGHSTNGGINGCDDTYAWDCNLSNDLDNGKDIYPVEDGYVSHLYGWAGSTEGQLLIRHVTNGVEWYSGYLHMSNITSKKSTAGAFVSKNEVIGKVSNKSANNIPNHLHFAIYYKNTNGKLVSVNRTFNIRDNISGPTINIIGNINAVSYPNSQGNFTLVQGQEKNISFTLKNITNYSITRNFKLFLSANGGTGNEVWNQSITFAPGQQYNFNRNTDSSLGSIVGSSPGNYKLYLKGGTMVLDDITMSTSNVACQSGNCNPQNISIIAGQSNYTVSTSSSPTSGGSTSGEGTYSQGQSCTVYAISNSGYSFNSWTENGSVVSSNSSYSFNVLGNRSLVANFTQQQGEWTACPNYNFSPGNGPNWNNHSGYISDLGNKIYRFLAVPGRTYTFKTGCGDGATAGFRSVLILMNSGCDVITSNAGGCEQSRSKIVWTCDFSSTSWVYLMVRGMSASAYGNYTLAFREISPVNDFIISTSCNPTVGGSTSGGGTYSQGQSCTLTASANSGYNFSNWKENGAVVSTNSTYSFNVNANRSLIANFSLKNYSISVSSSPTNGGSTTGGGSYSGGSTALLVATASGGYNFLNWTRNGTVVSTNSTYSFTVNSNQNLVANFALKNYTIATSSSPTEGGSTSGAGTYVRGSTATLVATPDNGYAFVNWTRNGNVISSNSTYSFTVNMNQTLVANFSQDNFTISTSSSPTNGGSTTGGGSYSGGSTALLVATASGGYNFVNWTRNGTVVSTNSTYSFTVNSNQNLVANFSLKNYTVTTNSSPTEGGSTSGAGTYVRGSTATLVATPGNGYAFVNWTRNGNVVSSNSTYSFTVNMNHNLVANFSQANFTISTSSSPTNGGSTTGGGSYSGGATAILVATASGGYNFVNWTRNGTVVSTNSTYSFTVNSNQSLLANFALKNYTVTTNSSPTEGGTTTGAGTYVRGSTATLIATPGNGFTFVNWTRNGTVVSTNSTYSFTVNINRTLIANFSQENFTITTSSNPRNGGTTIGGGTYSPGSRATLIATPKVGYIFLNWTRNGNVVSSKSTYTFIVNLNRNLVANFEVDNFVKTSSNPIEGGITTGGVNYQIGTLGTFMAIPNEGFSFLNWTKNGKVVSTENTYNSTIDSSDDLVANFQLKLSLVDQKLERIIVFPIPFDQVLNFQTGDIIIEKVHIYDLSGRLIMENIMRDEKEYRIDTEKLTTGGYLMKIFTSEGVKNLKVMKN